MVHSFIQYIPNPAKFCNDRFLQRIAQSIVTNVKSEKILLSRDEDWISPDEAMILPPVFIIDGQPLFDENDLKQFLNFDPPRIFLHGCDVYKTSQTQEVLRVLNCVTFEHKFVLQIVTHPNFAFQSRSLDWLRRFFKYICNLPHRRSSRYFNLPFLKLQNGAWISKGPSVYLPPIDRVPLPDQINLHTLDGDFYDNVWSDSLSRYFVTEVLGLERLTDVGVIKAIVTYHDNLQERRIQPPNHVLDVILDHAQYLSEHLDELRELRQSVSMLQSCFQLINTANNYGPACDVVEDTRFICAEGECLLSSISSPNVEILNTKKYDDMEAFIELLNLRKIPPLLRRYWQGQHLSQFYAEDIAPQRQHDNKLLYLLAAIWDSIKENDKMVVQVKLSSIKAFCKDRRLHALKECYLATPELENLLAEEMNILAISDANDRKWEFLEGLGVTTRPNVKLYLEKLHRLKTSDRNPALKESVGNIYEKLGQLCRPDEQLILRYDPRLLLLNLEARHFTSSVCCS